MKVDDTQTVLVTGATGYVASWLIQRLLSLGLTVHATVRDPNNPKKVGHLTELGQELPGELKLFKADLLDQGAFADAMQGCQVVFHTASPFITAVKDPQKDLVDPAVLGTRNVLEQATKTPSVKRVVLTSSVAAVMGDAADANGQPINESMWNTTSSLTHQAYSFSKTEAEKEGWKIADSQDQWDLVTINPALVVGPGINPYATSESFRIIKKLGNGTMAMGGPAFSIGIVDVRDVADAHVQAAFNPDAKGRYLLVERASDFYQMGKALRKAFPKYPLPRNKIPKPVLKLFGPMADKSLTREMVARNVNVPMVFDNSRSVNELGIQYTSANDSLVEHFQQLIDCGILKKR